MLTLNPSKADCIKGETCSKISNWVDCGVKTWSNEKSCLTCFFAPSTFAEIVRKKKVLKM